MFDFDVHALRSELIYTFRLPKEHDLHSIPLRVSVDEAAQILVNPVILAGNINNLVLLELAVEINQLDNLGLGHPELELKHLGLLKLLQLSFHLFKLLELCHLRLEVLIVHLGVPILLLLQFASDILNGLSLVLDGVVLV